MTFLREISITSLKRGKTLYKIHGNVGFDVAVIENHDYLMGAHDLNVILRDVDTSFQLLGANFYTHPKYTSVQEKLNPIGKQKLTESKLVSLELQQMIYCTNGELVKVELPMK